MRSPFAELFEGRQTRRREALIDIAAKNLTNDILYGKGDIGRRLRLSTQPQPKDDDHPLSKELLAGVDNHPLVVHTLRFTQRVLPVEHFVREDGKTPHIRHAERTALLLLDTLPKNMSADEKAVRVAIAVAHDSEEEPQERLMANLEVTKTGKGQIKPGGLTQEQTKAIFDKEMEGLPPELAHLAERVYTGIHTFNRHNADNSTKFDEDYIAGIRKEDLEPEKVVDRGMDSPQGDMSRIARMVEDALSDEEKIATLATDLAPRIVRLGKSINKARRLRPLMKNISEELAILFEATIRAGDNFPYAVAERIRQGQTTNV